MEVKKDTKNFLNPPKSPKYMKYKYKINTIQTQAIIDRLIETKKMNPQSQKIVTFSRDFRCLYI